MLKYYTFRNLEDRYQVGRSTIYRWMNCPKIQFPKPVKIGNRCLWRQTDLVEFDHQIDVGGHNDV